MFMINSDFCKGIASASYTKNVKNSDGSLTGAYVLVRIVVCNERSQSSCLFYLICLGWTDGFKATRPLSPVHCLGPLHMPEGDAAVAAEEVGAVRRRVCVEL